jgi:transposase InsO family protein
LAALTDALQRRQPAAGRLHHSDRGRQYVDGDYIAALRSAGIDRSMSCAGNCYDNAARESFSSALKSDPGLAEAIASQPQPHRACRLRLHRDLLQSEEAPQLAWLCLPCGVRKATNPKHQSRLNECLFFEASPVTLFQLLTLGSEGRISPGLV